MSFEIAIAKNRIPAMNSEAIARVYEYEAEALKRKQVPIKTFHILHAGMYTRMICLPKNVALTGALIKIATLLTINGDVTVKLGEKEVRYTGYQVFPASANRKQAFAAHEDTWITMQFATQAKTVEEAENEFTDESSILLSRHGENEVVITGE